jgi:hypothetical protein
MNLYVYDFFNDFCFRHSLLSIKELLKNIFGIPLGIEEIKLGGSLFQAIERIFLSNFWESTAKNAEKSTR